MLACCLARRSHPLIFAFLLRSWLDTSCSTSLACGRFVARLEVFLVPLASLRRRHVNGDCPAGRHGSLPMVGPVGQPSGLVLSALSYGGVRSGFRAINTAEAICIIFPAVLLSSVGSRCRVRLCFLCVDMPTSLCLYVCFALLESWACAAGAGRRPPTMGPGTGRCPGPRPFALCAGRRTEGVCQLNVSWECAR